MNLGQFHARISQAIKRGSSLDAIIPFWVADAARVQEQNYTFSWMVRTTEEMLPASNSELTFDLDPLVKSVNWIKPILNDANGDGTRWYGQQLLGVSSDQVIGISGGNPQGFYLEGGDTGYSIHFDAIPHSDFKFRIEQNVYTDWPVDDASVPVLLARGQLVLFAQTLVLFAQEQRDPRMFETYSATLQGAMNVLLRSEEELKQGHQNDQRMIYGGNTR